MRGPKEVISAQGRVHPSVSPSCTLSLSLSPAIPRWCPGFCAVRRVGACMTLCCESNVSGHQRGGQRLRVRSRVESRDEQQWLELDCCKPRNRVTTILCTGNKRVTSNRTDCSLPFISMMLNVYLTQTYRSLQDCVSGGMCLCPLFLTLLSSSSSPHSLCSLP